MSTITTLYDDIRAIIINTRNTIYKAVNTGILEANWKIGRRIVEEEQAGASRAEYGQRVINDLAEKLSVEFGRGFDAVNYAVIVSFICCSQNGTHCVPN